MRDILMVAHFTQTPFEKGNGRFHYLAGRLAQDNDNKVEVVTSTFSHSRKQRRIISQEQIEELPYRLTMLEEPGYRKNVSVGRLISHAGFAKRVKQYLKIRKHPDVIYCSVPSLDVAGVVTKYAGTEGIKLIIDIQDLWPEAFQMVIDIPLLSNLLFKPMKRRADYIYRNADKIVAVSETYMNRALSVSKKCEKGLAVYLGTELAVFDQYAAKEKLSKNDAVVRLVYVGALGHSYDLTIVFDALKALKEKKRNNIRFRVIGDGPLRKKFEAYSRYLGVDVEYTGRLEYTEMITRLTECDIAVNPIMHGAAQSIINKVGDYAAAGLPVISTQECPEYRELLSRYHAGINCENGNAGELAKQIMDLVTDREKRLEMGKNNRRMGEEMFDRKTSYQTIFEMIEGER